MRAKVSSVLLQRRRLQMVIGAANRPSPEKETAGEDAFVGDSAHGVLGVADGVGGWSLKGVDSGVFSRRFLALCHKNAIEHDAVSAIRRARAAIKTDPTTEKGSSTVVLASLRGDELEVANYGDSALAVLRVTPRQEKKTLFLYPRIVLRTQPQTSAFNTPYQASAEDDLSWEPSALGSYSEDRVTATLRPGDLVLAATDGLWDNLYDDDVLRLVASDVRVVWASAARHGLLDENLARASRDPRSFDPTADVLDYMAAVLADAAVALFDDATRTTPFTVEARAAGFKHDGGKADDVTVVLGLVVDGTLSANDLKLRHNFGSFGLDEDQTRRAD